MNLTTLRCNIGQMSLRFIFSIHTSVFKQAKNVLCVLILLTFHYQSKAQNNNFEPELKAPSVSLKDSAEVLSALKTAESFKKTNPQWMQSLGQQALNRAIQLQFFKGIALSQKTLASYYYNTGQYSQADSLLQIAIPLLNKYATIADCANATNLKALLDLSFAKYDAAEKGFQHAHQLFVSANDGKGQTKVLHNLGVTQFYLTNYNKAIEFYVKALLKADSINDLKIRAEILGNLGLSFSNQRDFNNARKYLKSALQASANNGNNWGVAQNFSGLGTMYFNMNKMDSAIYYQRCALYFYRFLGDRSGMAKTWNNIGEIYLFQEVYGKSLPYFDSSLNVKIANGEVYGMAITYSAKAKALAGLGQKQMAFQLLDSAARYTELSGNESRLSELYLSRSTIEEQYGDYKNALLNMKNYVNLRDSIYRKSKDRLAEELLANHEMEVQELELAKQSAAIKELKNQRFITTLLLLLVLVILLAALAFYQKRMAVQKLKLARSEAEKAETALSLQKAEVEQLKMKSDLEYKKRELSQLALYINEQHEFLESIKTKINHQNEGNFQTIERELQLNLAIGKQRQAFDLNIDLINNEFYKNLKSRFSSLTASDLRLCAMLKLQLSSKEMASVLNISSKSVDMNRYRLRKKLTLEGETDLVAFLQEMG